MMKKILRKASLKKKKPKADYWDKASTANTDVGSRSSSKQGTDEYDIVAIIGRGGFGEVRLCRHKQNGKLYAMKVMDKKEMKKKNQLNHLMTERDLLTKTVTNAHVVGIHSSFQDEKKLYLVMEYLAGGDLMELLIKRGHFTESETAFYLAELTLAVNAIHSGGYVHRDLKPDNVLLDKRGHIRLTDFGLCAEYTHKRTMSHFIVSDTLKLDPALHIVSEDGQDDQETVAKAEEEAQKKLEKLQINDEALKALASDQRPRKPAKRLRSVVGTPEYMAPEILEQSRDGYGPECDYWSMGIILFELLFGYRPFWAESSNKMVKQIRNFERYFEIPNDPVISDEAKDLLNRLICRRDKRLKFPEIKEHPFFRKIDWDNVKDQPACIVPKIDHELDLQNFPEVPERVESEADSLPDETAKGDTFKGYTFKAVESGDNPLGDGGFFDAPKEILSNSSSP